MAQPSAVTGRVSIAMGCSAASRAVARKFRASRDKSHLAGVLAQLDAWLSTRPADPPRPALGRRRCARAQPAATAAIVVLPKRGATMRAQARRATIFSSFDEGGFRATDARRPLPVGRGQPVDVQDIELDWLPKTGSIAACEITSSMTVGVRSRSDGPH